MSYQLSPDGRFWWDGQVWRPVPASPPVKPLPALQARIDYYTARRYKLLNQTETAAVLRRKAPIWYSVLCVLMLPLILLGFPMGWPVEEMRYLQLYPDGQLRETNRRPKWWPRPKW